MNRIKLPFLLFLFLPVSFVSAQTGKIAGRVTAGTTGDPLPGVNIIVESSQQGAVTDVDGYYTIINIRPGTYRVRASFIGFTSQIQADARVHVDHTTTVNFQMQEVAIGLDEIVVGATRPIVQPDVSANVAYLDPDQYRDVPVAGLSELINLQVGVEPGMVIRGGNLLNGVAFMIDGLNTRTGRDHTPITSVSFTSLEEVQVQTGGFNAEYGNVRAGIINLTTKEPLRDRYSFDGFFRVTPAQNKTFDALTVLPAECTYPTGDGLNRGDVDPNCDTPWVRPALDPAVNMAPLDASSVWDYYERRQYKSFEGWPEIATQLQASGFDVTPADLIRYTRYVHRKDNRIDDEYEVDFTLGGPVPVISKHTGDLRFLTSYRGTQNAYLYPQTRRSYNDHSIQGKIVSNIGTGLSLTLQGLTNIQRGEFTDQGLFSSDLELWNGELPAYPWFQGPTPITWPDHTHGHVYLDSRYMLADVDHNLLAARFTHSLSSKLFYEAILQRVASNYRSRYPNLRDGSYICPESGVGPDGEKCSPSEVVFVSFTDRSGLVNPGFENRVTCFGGDTDLNGDGKNQAFCVGEDPLGMTNVSSNLLGTHAHNGAWAGYGDTSNVKVWTGRFDLTSQTNRFLQLKTGAELIYSDYG